MGVDTNCPNCNAKLYLGTEFERTTCDRCPCVSWLVVEWELPTDTGGECDCEGIILKAGGHRRDCPLNEAK